MLKQEEYIEQAFLFRSFRERLDDGYSSQEILRSMKNELLNTTNLPLAVDFLLAELKFSGELAIAMRGMPHYFSAFQTFIIAQAERATGRLDFKIALEILEKEAAYRSQSPTPQGTFFYQLEALSRNRLGFDYGLEAISLDPIFDDSWRRWINVVLRRQIGIVELTDLVYVRSELYRLRRDERKGRESLSLFEEEPCPETLLDEGESDHLFVRSGHLGCELTADDVNDTDTTILFGEKEGRIALASRHRDPALFFAALSRHLGYPSVPRPKRVHEEANLIPVLKRRIELLEGKLELLEEELHGGINLERFYVKKD
ncbi:MAG: hypothetical protein PHQ75_12775, partial [Thermoguttaceae bacterium]|nr:hypothetical protein [Thermoguttaceae bacterium]